MAKFRILSLDGGGIRGAFTAAFLAELEKEMGQPLGRYFDLIVGTSTGGIIAAALALEEPAGKIKALYEQNGSAIFSRQPQRQLHLRSWWRTLLARLFRGRVDRWLSPLGIDIDYILQPKYGATALKGALLNVFADRTIVDASTRLVIPAVDLSTGRTIVFKTPHLPDAASRDRYYKVADVVLGTAAAPTYFPHVEIGRGSAFCDGGLWANNPSMVAYAEAVKISESCKRPDIDPAFAVADIWMLSVGTGESNYSVVPPSTSAGLGWWAPRLIDVMSLSQSQGTECIAKFILGGDRYRRVNYTIPDKGWKLDSTELLDRFVYFGKQEAHRQLSELKTHFFAEPAPRYTAFDGRASITQ